MRICFFGDSFVNGTGDSECLGWTGRVCADARKKGLDVTHYNLGIRRDTSTDIVRRWFSEALLRLPREVDGRLVFSFGVNDCVVESGRRRVPPEETLANAETIMAKASRWKPTLVVGPPPVANMETNGRIQSLSGDLAGLSLRMDVPYLDVYGLLSRSDSWLRELEGGDGAHPGADGYETLASLVKNWRAWSDWMQPQCRPNAI